METQTQEIALQSKLESTVLLVEQCKKLVIRNAQEFAVAKSKLDDIRTLEKDLEIEYKSLPVIIEAKKILEYKGDIARMLETARKDLKNGQMLAYERVEEEKRQAEERRIAAELKAKADAEAKALAEIERKKAEAARAEAARAKARGDAEAERLAKEKQAQAKAEAERIKEEAKNAAPIVVVVPKTAPKVTRRTIWSVRVDDTSKLIDYVAKNPQFKRFLVADETQLRKFAEAIGEGVVVPGVTFTPKSV